MSILGRKSAERILRDLHKRVSKFYDDHKGKNKNDGSKSSRADAIEFIDSLTPLYEQFAVAYEKPLDVDALKETA
jgi:hypothetical protein